MPSSTSTTPPRPPLPTSSSSSRTDRIVRPKADSRYATAFFRLATFALVVTLMRVAEDVLIPIALSVMLAFLLTPLVTRFTRWGLPKAMAIITAVVFGFAVIATVGWVVTTQLLGLVGELPNYEQNIHDKISALKKPSTPGPLSKTSEIVETLRKDLQTPSLEEAAAQKDRGGEPRPVPVEIHPPKPSSFEVARQIIGPILGPLGVGGIVIVFVVAMLFQREDLRDRFLKVVSRGQLNVATQAVDDAASRVARYLLMQLVVNATYGFPIGIALYFIGIPNALLWGLLATLLRFIPFLGPWVAASFPVILAIAVDPGWTKLAYTLGVFIVMEVVSNNIVEPMLYGASTGISNLALLVAAVFWTWLWGTPGLFLSTPLTVCLVVLGKYVPGLEFLSVLLGSAPVLEPPAQLYQRMLSMDSEQMFDIAVKYIDEHSLTEFYDNVFVPALLLSEEDRHSGALAEMRQKFIFEAGRELIEELERRSENQSPTPASVQPGEQSPALPGTASAAQVLLEHPSETTSPVVFGIPARDDADELVALMLRHLLREQGLATTVCPVATSAEKCAESLGQNSVKAAFISGLPPSALLPSRQTYRRLKEHRPRLRTVVGVWSREANVTELKQRLGPRTGDELAIRLGEAVKHIVEAVKVAAPETAASLPVTTSKDEEKRLKEIDRLGLLNTAPDELFDAVVRDLAHVFNVPISLVSIVDSDRQFWKAHLGLPPDLAEARESPRETSICGHVITEDALLVVEDTTKDRRFADNPFLTERGIRFYAGAPLRTKNGQLVGSLCVIDTKPRQLDDRLQCLLKARAAELMEAVETRQEMPAASARRA